MDSYPNSIEQYAELGQLLADALGVAVLFLEENEHPAFKAGWAYVGSDVFGVMNGNFSTQAKAYAELACYCMDACYVQDDRYSKHVPEEGRSIIMNVLEAKRTVERVRLGARLVGSLANAAAR